MDKKTIKKILGIVLIVAGILNVYSFFSNRLMPHMWRYITDYFVYQPFIACINMIMIFVPIILAISIFTNKIKKSEIHVLSIAYIASAFYYFYWYAQAISPGIFKLFSFRRIISQMPYLLHNNNNVLLFRLIVFIVFVVCYIILIKICEKNSNILDTASSSTKMLSDEELKKVLSKKQKSLYEEQLRMGILSQEEYSQVIKTISAV